MHMDLRLHRSRRSFIAAGCGGAFAVPFAVVARAESEAERRAKSLKVAKSVSWMLGMALSKAAIMHVARNEPETKRNLALADRATAFLGVELKPFPAKSSELNPVQYFVSGDGAAIGASIAKTHGREPALLYELAVKSTVFGLTYKPEHTNLIRSFSDTLKSICEEIQLPPQFWSPLLAAINNKKSWEEINNLVFDMH